MSANIEAGKASRDVQEDDKTLQLSRSHTESTLEEALDAEANITPEEANQPSVVEKSNDPGPPPDGGLTAWVQVAGSFFLFFNSWYEHAPSIPSIYVEIFAPPDRIERFARILPL